MTLHSQHELEVTREKLQLLEEHYKANQREQGGDERVRRLTMLSLKRLINQLKEEIVRFESRRARTSNGISEPNPLDRQTAPAEKKSPGT